jgi:prevent-host-death family protein
MKTVGLYEAKTHLGELIKEVENGETLIVTRRGVPVARVIPFHDEFADAAAAIDDWRRYRTEHNIRLGGEKSTDDAVAAMEELHRFRREPQPMLGDVTIRELIEEGRE